MDRKLQITVEAVDKATDQLKKIREQIEGMGKAGEEGAEGAKKAGVSIEGLAGKIGPAILGIVGITSALGALKKGMDLVAESTLLAARVETLGVVTDRLGANIGMTNYEIDLQAESLQKLGITTQASEQSIARMIQSNIDLADSTALAREAQDAAVIANTNSSEAFERLTTTIATGNVEMARTMGLNVNFQKAYQNMAESLGKSTSALTETEKVQARTNEVLAAGATITGTYTAAMNTAGKQLTSMPRYLEEFKLALGKNYQEPLSIGIGVMTDFLKANTAALQGGTALKEAREKGIITDLEYYQGIHAINLGLVGLSDNTKLLTRAEDGLEQEQIQLNAASKLGAGQMADYAAMLGTANQATVDLTSTQDVFEGKLKNLQTLIDGKLGESQTTFIGSQEELRDKMREVNDEADHLVSLGWSEQSTKVQELRDQYGQLQGQFADNAAAHEDATRRMLFDILTQQAAMDGLTSAEIGFLTTLAGPEGWGLIDEATANATENALAALDGMNAGVLSSSELVEYLLTDWNSFTDRTVTITTIHEDIYRSRTELNTANNGGVGQTINGVERSGGTGGEQRAAGGMVSAGSIIEAGERMFSSPEFFVPAQNGYVLTKQDAQRALGGGNGGNSIQININGAQDPRAVAQQIMAELRLQGVAR